MKKLWSRFVFFLLVAVLSGCASLTGVDPSSLKETKKKNYVIVKDDYKWEETFSLAKLTHYMTLKSGNYKAYLDDRQGTYYEGEGACLEWKVAATSGEGTPTVNNHRCGVYVPNNENKRIIIYYYIDPEASKKIMDQTKPGLLIEALDKAEWDNLKHLMYQPEAMELKSHIEIVN
jgi:hypothetical protein